MSGTPQPTSFFIGWDVGGWNCDKNSKSRDAIVILDSNLSIVGQPWRGNLRTSINEAATTGDWIGKLFSLCAADQSIASVQATLAIDTPLGFSKAFAGLVTELQRVESVGDWNTNPYLFRHTELYLFQQGLAPLSAIKDMIGSQATKGMHVLAKFAPDSKSCGVWTGGSLLTAIEAYPASCKRSATIQKLRSTYSSLGHEDKEDALTCALIAYLFAQRREALDSPGDAVPSDEGWIWVPRDTFVQEHA
jgi:hypothetical protein